METGTWKVKMGLAQMLKGGVIMDVVTPEHAKIAEEAVESFKAQTESVARPAQNIRRTVNQWDDEPDEKYTVQENMQKFGGSFVQAQTAQE